MVWLRILLRIRACIASATFTIMGHLHQLFALQRCIRVGFGFLSLRNLTHLIYGRRAGYLELSNYAGQLIGASGKNTAIQ